MEAAGTIDEADKFAGVIYAEYVASQPLLAPHAAPLGEAGAGAELGVKLWKALSQSEDATWQVLDLAKGDPRAFEFTVRACELILNSTPTAAKAALISEKLTTALAQAAEGARYKQLSELLAERPLPDVGSEPPPPTEGQTAEEAKDAWEQRKYGAIFVRGMKALWARMLDRRQKRILHFQQRPWRALARTLLARCVHFNPPPPPPPGVGEDGAPLPPPPPPPEGAHVLKELARGAVIAERAECPAMLLHTCAQLRNFFDELPAAVECTLTYGRFEAMPRASQADPPDPPPAIVPALWKPLARASQALLSLLGQLHGGLPLGGRDPFALALAGTSAAELAVTAETDVWRGTGVSEEDVSTHVKGPKRWFETRETAYDVEPLNLDWICDFVHLTLRQLQLARRWRLVAELALSFDDLTEGTYGTRMLPFLEQAQQKLHATKWADGNALPQVAKRVAELVRDQSACVQAIEACRKAVHALCTPGGGVGNGFSLDGSGTVAEKRSAALERAHHLCKESATLCRSRRETTLLIESLGTLGSLQLEAGKVSRAAEAWNMALDDIFNTQDVTKLWQGLFAPTAPPLPAKYSLAEMGRALAVLGGLARHTTYHRLERRLQHALFASHLCVSITSTSITHPSRLIDWAGYRLTELPAGTLDAKGGWPDGCKGMVVQLELLDGLHALATTLLQYELPLRALPILATLKHLATDVARDVTHSVGADALMLMALTALGQLDHASVLLANALAGADLPRDALELLPPPPLAEGHRPTRTTCVRDTTTRAKSFKFPKS